ncbi:hypothetical protein [Dyadobacter tibetensis]|uniref:hypothetical protein n=1 Tax=Dyadobacter tibetensis TaxID=1211851 RepID=UPI00046F4BE8|nr:hypothetical protein [Dyadobacter tibetensis]
MKTDQFDKNIRRKLESISPSFEEKSWTAMQEYMDAQSPPTLWQQYKGWSGYAAAASVLLLTALLYAGQLQKNRQLMKAVTGLEQEMKEIKSGLTPPVGVAATTDTVYIMQKEYIALPAPEEAYAQTSRVSPKRMAAITSDSAPPLSKPSFLDPASQVSANPSAPKIAASIDSSSSENVLALIPDDLRGTVAEGPREKMEPENRTGISTEIIGSTRADYPVEAIKSSQTNQDIRNITSDYRMEYALKSRISPSRVSKSLGIQPHIPVDHQLATKSKTLPEPNGGKGAALPSSTGTIKTNGLALAEKEVNALSTLGTEQTIPDLPLKNPYRFGFGYGWEGNSQVKSLVADVQISKKFSLITGLSWLKGKPLEFLNEKMFREKNRTDFKKEHYDKIPQAMEVVNIRVEPTTLQIPLTLAFRSNIAKDLDYYVMGGTQITVSAKDRFDYNMLPPGSGYQGDYYDTGFTKNKKMPLFNTFNAGMGIEKSWHPVVVQMEGYYFHYFTPNSPASPKNGPGLRLKLLYQIGKDA